MRRLIGAIAVVAAAGGCHWAGERGMGWDERLDDDEAQVFLQRWNALSGEKTPQAARQRAELGLEALDSGLGYRLPGLPRDQLMTLGQQAAEQAIRGRPQDGEAYGLLAAYQLAGGEIGAAAESACRGAAVSPKNANALETCGDYLLASGDGNGAVKQWKEAFAASFDRDQQFDLLDKISRTSPSPTTELASLPQELVEQYRERQKAKLPRGHGMMR